jgi:hypothetical protein
MFGSVRIVGVFRRARTSVFVIPGLDPGISDPARCGFVFAPDARVKHGHDDF